MVAPYDATERGLVRGRTVRFTQLDACGATIAAPAKTSFVTAGFIQATTTKNMDSGEEINVRGANGIIQEYEPGRKSLLAMDIDIELIKVDPAAIAMLTGDPYVLDWQGTIVGWEELGQVQLTTNFAMEIWTATAGIACQAGGLVNGYMLYPLISQGWVEFADITSKEVTATIHGMTYPNAVWAIGPPNYKPVSADAINTPSRLIAPVGAGAHRHFELTPIAPPAVSVGGPGTI